MELYIDNINVFANDKRDLEPNITLKALDTYNPSAVKADTSKTISIPDTVNANIVFGTRKPKYDFRLVDNKLFLEGYCTLDNITYNKGKKEYNITLYSSIAEFFFNLKGESDNPKKLSDMYWKFINESTGEAYTKEEEDELTLFTNNKAFVYSNWHSDLEFDDNGKHINTTFKPVPCETENAVDHSKTLINNSVALFPIDGPEGSTCAEDTDGKKYLLVESADNTSYGKKCHYTSQMPIGVSYRSIIETICDSDNNGGYTVELDNDFFNEENPYWTKPYVLIDTIEKIDSEKTVYTIGDLDENNDYFQQPILNIPNNTLTPVGGKIRPIVTSLDSPYEVDANYNLKSNKLIYGNKFRYHIPLILEVPDNSFNALWFIKCDERYRETPTTFDNLSNNYLSLNLIVKCYKEVGGAPQVVETKTYDILTPGGSGIYKNATRYSNIENTIFETGNIYVFQRLDNNSDSDYYRTYYKIEDGEIVLPDDYNYFSVELSIAYNIEVLYYSYATPTISRGITGAIQRRFTFSDLTAISMHTPATAEEYNINPIIQYDYVLTTDYYDADSEAFVPKSFKKSDIFKDMLTPFDYLINYTKMFNLRYKVDYDKKHIYIGSFNSFYRVGGEDIENIDANIDYSSNYISKSKVSDNSAIKFKLNAGENDIVTRYGEEPLSYSVSIAEEGEEKDYFETEFTIGSKNRFETAYVTKVTTLDGTKLYYYGFNQPNKYNLYYKAADYDTSNNFEEGEGVQDFVEAVNQYDFLQVKDINNTIVMFEGYRNSTIATTPDNTQFTTLSIISEGNKTTFDYCKCLPFLSGLDVNAEDGDTLTFFYSPCILIDRIPIFGLTSNFNNFEKGLSYKNLSYYSLAVNSNIYDLYFKDMIDKVYKEQEEVECSVRFIEPVDMRKIYYFNDCYWILSEVQEYNYNDDFVTCKFVKYLK